MSPFGGNAGLNLVATLVCRLGLERLIIATVRFVVGLAERLRGARCSPFLAAFTADFG
jgi:hypothetical protein